MALNAAAAKYKLTSEPALPAKCVGCRRDYRNGQLDFVDLDESIDYYGALLLCGDCAREIANLVGYVHGDVVLALDSDVKTAKDKLGEAEQKIEALENVVRAYGLSQFVITDEPDSDATADSGEVERIIEAGKPEPGLFE